MRDVMSNKSKSKKDEPKTVTLTVSKAADFKGKKRTSVTVRELHRPYTMKLQLT